MRISWRRYGCRGLTRSRCCGTCTGRETRSPSHRVCTPFLIESRVGADDCYQYQRTGYWRVSSHRRGWTHFIVTLSETVPISRRHTPVPSPMVRSDTTWKLYSRLKGTPSLEVWNELFAGRRSRRWCSAHTEYCQAGRLGLRYGSSL